MDKKTQSIIMEYIVDKIGEENIKNFITQTFSTPSNVVPNIRFMPFDKTNGTLVAYLFALNDTQMSVIKLSPKTLTVEIHDFDNITRTDLTPKWLDFRGDISNSDFKKWLKQKTYSIIYSYNQKEQSIKQEFACKKRNLIKEEQAALRKLDDNFRNLVKKYDLKLPSDFNLQDSSKQF